jgi:D-beta-D-heptose 7-phosphate kinase/D-beta-D-heptose 1-phosphate adenosyltransferase
MSKDSQQQRRSKILLIGDTCIDEYYYGECTRINPEAPVPLFNIEYLETLEGMSGNVKKNLLGLGFDVTHVTNSEIIKKTRYIEKNYNCQVLRVDTNAQVKRINLKKFKKKFDSKKIKKYDYLVFSDYNKGFINNFDIKEIIKYVKNIKSDISIFADTKKSDMSCFTKCYLKVNEHEFDIWKKQPNNCEIIVTLGDKGAMYKDKIYPAFELNINNVTKLGDRCGAGDTFLSGLIYCHSLDKDIGECIKFANYCASLSVKKIGVYHLKRSDVEDICI